MTTQGDRRGVASRNELVQENLGLVLRVARQYQRRGLSMDDLVGEGNLGLIRAAEEFDPALGTRFSTYATYWIREAIRSALDNTGTTIRLPAHVSRLMGRWQRTEKALSHSRGYQPTFEEVAAAMGLDAASQRQMAQAHRVSPPCGATGAAGHRRPSGRQMLDERATAEDSLNEREERESVSRRLAALDATERAVVMLKFGMTGEAPLGFEQIGGRLGMSPWSVQRVATSAIRKLGRDRGAAEEDPARSGGPSLTGRLMVG